MIMFLCDSVAIIVLCLIIIVQITDLHKVHFIRLKDNAIIPTKRDEDGCFDLYACLDEDVTIQPNETKLIPTGLASVFSEELRIAFRERGSNTKWYGQIMAGQIDSNYRGEYFIAVHNCGIKPILLHGGDLYNNITETDTNIIVPTKYKALCQFAVEKVPNVKIVEENQFFLDKYKTERGTGKLGSSGK